MLRNGLNRFVGSKNYGMGTKTQALLLLVRKKPQFLEFLIITLMPYLQRARGVISRAPNDPILCMRSYFMTHHINPNPGCGHTITKKSMGKKYTLVQLSGKSWKSGKSQGSLKMSGKFKMSGKSQGSLENVRELFFF